MNDFKLNIAQSEALSAIDIVRKRGITRGVAVLPTATGKTILSIQDSMNFKEVVSMRMSY